MAKTSKSPINTLEYMAIIGSLHYIYIYVYVTVCAKTGLVCTTIEFYFIVPGNSYAHKISIHTVY